MKRARVLAAVAAAVLGVSTVTAVAATASPRAASSAPSEVGLSDKQIHVAVIADVDTSLVPGLFKSSVDAMRAWAKHVNSQGGVAGRQVVIDFYDSKLNPTQTRNAIIQACQNDFAMVGGEALFMSNVSDMTSCKDAAGNVTGLPDVPGTALDPNEQCAPVTYDLFAIGSYCSTRDQHPQTYQSQTGDARYYLKKFKNLHGIFAVASDLKSTRNNELPTFTADAKLGMKKDGQGFYDVSARAPQSAVTPFIEVVKQNNSNFVYNGSAPSVAVELRKEAVLQGANSVKVWACNQACYTADFIKQAGSDAEGETSVIYTLPFYSEYKTNPSLQALVKGVGGVNNTDSNAVFSWVSALLFQDAMAKAAKAGPLTRKSLLTALANEHSFDAQGITGPNDVGNRRPPACIMIAQVKRGRWQRLYPTKAGTFDCDKKNVATSQMDLG